VTRKALPVCGMLAALLYIATDILAALRYQGYSYTGQTVSETFAIGAPTRSLVVLRGLAYSLLLITFGWGVRQSAGGKHWLRVAGGLLLTLGFIDLAGPFAPMHQRTVLAAGGGTLTDTLHIILASVDVLLILLIVGFGANAFGKQFRLYSIATILVVILFGALAGLDGPRVAANLPTPWVGVTERICIYAYMLWVAVLSATLLRSRSTVPSDAFAARSDAK
jgi:hypothetical protein